MARRECARFTDALVCAFGRMAVAFGIRPPRFALAKGAQRKPILARRRYASRTACGMHPARGSWDCRAGRDIFVHRKLNRSRAALVKMASHTVRGRTRDFSARAKYCAAGRSPVFHASPPTITKLRSGVLRPPHHCGAHSMSPC